MLLRRAAAARRHAIRGARVAPPTVPIERFWPEDRGRLYEPASQMPLEA